jgi:glycosyltransferase involved in cell wall biosynthesis
MEPSAGLAHLPNVEVCPERFVSYAEFAAYFAHQSADILIAPLLDNSFNRCKSSIKFLEYAWLGIPGVYSRLEPYESVVQHGQNGFLAATLEEWEARLTELVSDGALRQRLGRAAQATVQQQWLLSNHGEYWAEQMQQAILAGQNAVPVARIHYLADKFTAWNAQDHALLRAKGETIQSLSETIQQQQALLQQQQALLQQQQQELNRIPFLESNVAQQERLTAEQRAETARVQGILDAIIASPGWRALNVVYAIRLKLIPRGTLRERLLFWGLRALPRLKHKVLALFRRQAAPPPAFAPSSLQVQDTPARSLRGVSLIFRVGDVDENAVVAWAQQQTWPPEVVRWDRSAGVAATLGQNPRSWGATDLEGLCQELAEPFLCFASHDLLLQHAAYLEMNLIALESENLAFTLNANGVQEWPLARALQGRLPGGPEMPFVRMVVRKDCVRKDFSVDILAHTAQVHPRAAVVAKLIQHTTHTPDTKLMLPIDTPLLGAEVSIYHQTYILARSRADIGWESRNAELYTIAATPSWCEKPTVLMLFPFLAIGGAEQLHLNLVKSLQTHIRFVIFTVDPLDAELGSIAEVFRKVTPWVYQTPDFLHPALRASFLWYLVERFSPTTLYIANGSPWVYDLFPEIKKRYPQLRIADQVYDSHVGWINRYDTKVVTNVDICIGANRKICQAYTERGIPASRVHLVPHSVDAEALQPDKYSQDVLAEIRQKLGLPSDRKVVAFAARLHQQKRPLDFVELARRMATDSEVIFLMAGNGPLAPVVDETIRRIGLKNIVRCGFFRPVGDLLAAIDVLVLPSEFEGMPLIVSEAQWMGKPVVVTDVGNNRELLQVSQGGVVVPIGDVTGLVAGVQQMLREPPDPQQVRSALLAEFGLDVVAKKYREVLVGSPNA